MDLTGPTRGSGGTGAHRPLSAALAATLDELRAEVAQHIADPKQDGRIPHLIYRIAQQARADGLRAEQVVIALGEVWHNFPSTTWAAPSRRDEVRWAVVSALITAFYEGDPGSGAPPA